MKTLTRQRFIAFLLCFVVCLACGMAWVDQESSNKSNAKAKQETAQAETPLEPVNQPLAEQKAKEEGAMEAQGFKIDLSQSQSDGAPAVWEFVFMPKNTKMEVSNDSARAFLGVHVRKADETLRNQLAIQGNFGLVVEHVVKDSAANKHNIEIHDVLLKLESQWLVNQEQMQTLVDAKKPGDLVKVEYFRGGEIKSANVVLSERQNVSMGASMSELQSYHSGLMIQDGVKWDHASAIQIHDCRACHTTSETTLAKPVDLFLSK